MSRWRSRSTPNSIAVSRPLDLGRLRVAWTQDFGQCPVSADIRKVFATRIDAIRHLFRACDEIAFDFGEADRCFDVIRAQNYIARHQSAYLRDPSSLGPNVRVNYEMGGGMTLADVVWAHGEQTRTLPALPGRVPRL